MKGLDPVNSRLFVDMILAERDRGATILFSSHQMDDVEKMANDILILKGGHIVASGALDTVKKEHGHDTIKVAFTGKFPKNDALYTATLSNTYAELSPTEGTPSDAILAYLVEKGLHISSYELSLPSLSDIFIKINSQSSYAK